MAEWEGAIPDLKDVKDITTNSYLDGHSNKSLKKNETIRNLNTGHTFLKLYTHASRYNNITIVF